MKLLTTTQAAARLQISERRVLQLIKKGDLPATKFGRDWQIKERDLNAFTPRRRGRPRKTFESAAPVAVQKGKGGAL
ncbi:MAG: helix-turn-helix domain-containing protein [Candidatus Omnitrophota bacterium]|jgi:excisionase family DNA binding protein